MQSGKNSTRSRRMKKRKNRRNRNRRDDNRTRVSVQMTINHHNKDSSAGIRL